ncbi:MAG: hypothetical protein P1U89_23155 [Verrucomicrobiales bacterium]|nr:hypothetical protein [Verrucomicrobiales bacterium]
MNRCIEMNLEILGKIRELLSSIDPSNYQQPHAQFFDSSIGGHVRHILDFYERFFEGSDTKTVDYSNRKRDINLEQLPLAALSVLDTILIRIRELVDGPVTVISDSGESFASSLGRELEFLAGHAVHHNAMIVAMSRSQDIIIAPEIAFAKSTLDYRKASA